jgi:hypothetical protein
MAGRLFGLVFGRNEKRTSIEHEPSFDPKQRVSLTTNSKLCHLTGLNGHQK